MSAERECAECAHYKRISDSCQHPKARYVGVYMERHPDDRPQWQGSCGSAGKNWEAVNKELTG